MKPVLSTNRLGNPTIWILAVLMLTVVIGFVLADDYGPSIDEPSFGVIGSQTVAAYLTMTAPTEWEEILRFYGPFYLSVREVVTEVVNIVFPSTITYDVGHFVYFLSLPIAMASLYYIAQRWTSRLAALVATVLFASQPLIFGHAFINPKDAPFLAFFLASIALGLWMLDKLDRRGIWFSAGAIRTERAWSGFGDVARSHFEAISRGKKGLLLFLLVFASLLSIELLAFQRWIRPELLELVRSAHSQAAWAPINELFLVIAEKGSDLPADLYVSKVEAFYEGAKRSFSILSFAPALILAALIMAPLARRIQPDGLVGATAAAAAILGLTISIRVVGPFAGLLITILAILKSRRGSIVPLALYWSIAGLVAYATWPYLWGAPIQRFLESLAAMGNFEWGRMPVLFEGMVQQTTTLPRYFLPVVLGIQLTEPALLLAAMGLLVGIRQIGKRSEFWIEKTLVAAWLLVPLAFAMIRTPSFYDNGRQFLFILPPIFLFSALGIGELLVVIRSKAINIAIIGLIVVPGVLAILRLHPYEYVYYNSLVGGVSGAYRNYELDYWVTSYREALEIVNNEAPLGSTIYIWGGYWHLVWHLAREDLEIFGASGEAFDPQLVDYIIVTTRANFDAPFHEGTSQIGQVSVDGVPLAYVLEILH